jgi:hypothetical protein
MFVVVSKTSISSKELTFLINLASLCFFGFLVKTPSTSVPKIILVISLDLRFLAMY